MECLDCKEYMGCRKAKHGVICEKFQHNFTTDAEWEAIESELAMEGAEEEGVPEMPMVVCNHYKLLECLACLDCPHGEAHVAGNYCTESLCETVNIVVKCIPV